MAYELVNNQIEETVVQPPDWYLYLKKLYTFFILGTFLAWIYGCITIAQDFRGHLLLLTVLIAATVVAFLMSFTLFFMKRNNNPTRVFKFLVFLPVIIPLGIIIYVLKAGFLVLVPPVL